jgi:5-methylcytosine-specific restriction endonuclease McrA
LDSNIKYKTCSICKVNQKINNFYKISGTKNFRSWCRSCYKDYNLKNRERKKNYDFVYRQVNKERIAKVSRKYHVSNPERARDAAHRRRSIQMNNGSFKIYKKELFKIYNSPCFYCGSLNKITIDHIVPISRGGAHSIGNLVAACAFCNGSKHNKLLVEWKYKT